MKITLKDGSVKEYQEAKSVIDIAKDISEGLARVACAGEVNGEVVDLRTVLDSDCELNIVTANDAEGLKVTEVVLFVNSTQALLPNLYQKVCVKLVLDLLNVTVMSDPRVLPVIVSKVDSLAMVSNVAVCLSILKALILVLPILAFRLNALVIEKLPVPSEL